MTELINELISISENAAAAILEIYNSDFSVDNKADDSPLTRADIASHTIICKALQELTPNIPLLSEESSSLPWDTRKTWNKYWLIDPLDGTREFIKRNGEFTVNIALIENNEPILGVVYVPVTGICYFASKGHGAFKQESDNRQRISTRKTDRANIVMSGSRSHGSERQEEFLRALGEDTEIIAIGSSLKFCLVAEGTVDIYPRFGPTSEWDTAAAHCVVNEAGGTVVDLDFKPLLYNSTDSILNPEFLVIADTGFDWSVYLNNQHA